MYREGLGVPKDDDQAVAWFRKAAVQGLPQAYSMLCEQYHICTFREDAEVAQAETQVKALERESAKRDYEASVMLQTGNGMPRDETKALQLLRRAAEKGNTDAQCALGQMLADGKGVQRDRVQAYAYLRRTNELNGPCQGKLTELERHMTSEELQRTKVEPEAQ